jgi:hypothetical protein
LDAGHNISPRLHKQLVLELEVWKLLAELRKRLPSGVIVGKALPFDQQAPLITTLLSLQDALRSRKMPAVKDRRQHTSCCRRVAAVGLEQPHMEDVVEPSALRKLQAVSDGTDAFQNTERTGKLRTELALRPRVKGLSRPVEQAQIDPIPDRKLHVAVPGIVVLLGQLLRLEKALTHLSQDHVPVSEKRGGRLRTGRPWLVWQERRRGTIVDHLKGSSTQGHVE